MTAQRGDLDAPVLSAKDRATRLLALRVVKDWIAAEDKALREGLVTELVVGERVSGLADPDDKESLLGFCQLTKGRESATVTDPAAFLEWVRAVAPTEIVTVEKVRDSFTAAVLAEVKSHGGWITPDGELLDPDGIEVRTGSPVLTVKPTASADGLVRDALASRRLQIEPPAA